MKVITPFSQLNGRKPSCPIHDPHRPFALRIQYARASFHLHGSAMGRVAHHRPSILSDDLQKRGSLRTSSWPGIKAIAQVLLLHEGDETFELNGISRHPV